MADAAAEEAAGHHMKFDALEAKVDTWFGDVRAEFVKVRAEMAAGFADGRAEMTAKFAEMTAKFADNRASIRILQWGQALIVAGIVSLVAKAYFHAG